MILNHSPTVSVGLVQPPTRADVALSPAECVLALRHILQNPLINRGVVDGDDMFLQHLFELAIAERIRYVPPYIQHGDRRLEMCPQCAPFEDHHKSPCCLSRALEGSIAKIMCVRKPRHD